MNSISFPRMFGKNSTLVKTDSEAVKQNVRILMLSECGELSDDPAFGLNIKQFMFEQNNEVLKDALIDDIYTQMASFMPQLRVQRKDISIVQDHYTLYATIKALNLINYTTDMYNIVLFTEDN